MNKPGVTVVVTYHNEPLETLLRALKSVVDQTLPAYEWIVIDDGSDESLEDLLARSSSRGPSVIHVTNRGLPAARNAGLMLCETEAILFLDADDWLDPTYLEKTYPLLEDADVVLTGLQEHGPVRQGVYMPGYDKPWDQVSLEDQWRMNRFFYCSLFRTQTLREVGGYNPLMAGAWNKNGGLEDWDLTIDLMSRGVRYTAINEVLFHYSTDNPNSMIHRSAQNRDALLAEMRRHHRMT